MGNPGYLVSKATQSNSHSLNNSAWKLNKTMSWLRLIKAFSIVAVCCLVSGCEKTPAVLPPGITTPAGWKLITSQANDKIGFEGTLYYLRMSAPIGPEQAALQYANALLAGDAAGFELEGPTKMTDEEMEMDRSQLDDFAASHSIDRTKYKSGWRVWLSNEPSYYSVYAYPDGDGSVVEMLNSTAL